MGSYIEFISAMLDLRKQKLAEEQLKAEAERANLAAITESISSLGSSIGSAVSSYSKGTAANKLMNQATPPRAEAVMPGTTTPNVALNQSAAASVLPGQIPYSEVPVTATPATGGEAELKMRMAMDTEARKRISDTIAINQKERALTTGERNATTAENSAALSAQREQRIIDQNAEAVKRQQSADQVKAYENTYKASSKEYQAAQKDAKAFDEATKLALDAVNQAPDQKKYVDALGFLESHYQAAQKQGLKVEKPQIASWEEHQAVKAKQAAITEAAAGGPADYMPWNNAGYVKSVPGLQKELEAMPGYNKYGPGNVPIIGEGKEAQVAPNYLATPAMEKPVYAPPGQPVSTPTGQVAAPVTGATAAPGGSEQSITADEAIAMGISKPIVGKRYEETDEKGIGTGKFFRVR